MLSYHTTPYSRHNTACKLAITSSSATATKLLKSGQGTSRNPPNVRPIAPYKSFPWCSSVDRNSHNLTLMHVTCKPTPQTCARVLAKYHYATASTSNVCLRKHKPNCNASCTGNIRNSHCQYTAHNSPSNWRRHQHLQCLIKTTAQFHSITTATVGTCLAKDRLMRLPTVQPQPNNLLISCTCNYKPQHAALVLISDKLSIQPEL
jgi:hypothetical protein